MIRKLAEELAFNGIVPGDNEIRPLATPAPAAEKAHAKDSVDTPNWTSTAHDANADGQSGVLGRALDGFKAEAGKYNDALAKHLGEHVRKITGSVSQSRAAVLRHRSATEG